MGMGVGHAPILGVALLVVLAWTRPCAAHTPDWTSRLLEWLFGKKASVGDAPSAGWLSSEPAAGKKLLQWRPPVRDRDSGTWRLARPSTVNPT